MGTLVGSAVKMPSTSFQTWSSSALTPTATRAAQRSVYPLPISPSINPPGTGPKYPVMKPCLLWRWLNFSYVLTNTR